MLKKFRFLALSTILVLVFVSCTTFAAKKPVKLTYGHIYAASDCYCEGDRYFKQLVEKKSKGQIIVDFFPGGQLGNQSEMIQATKAGAQQMILTSAGGLYTLWPKIGTFELPYLYRDQQHYLKVVNKLNSLIDQDEMMAKTGMRILSVRIRAPRQLTTKFPVNKLEDIKGLKIRTPESAVYASLWRALGAIPTTISGSEIYTALATGTVEAQENPFDVIYNYKFYEVQKYCARTAHIREITLMLINKNSWKSLTKVQQKIISDAAAKSAEMMIKAIIDNEEKYYQLLVNVGMKFTEPDTASFRERAKTIWSQFGDTKIIKKVEAVK
jgi:tripartite ATP-independent transporter DctP family solute receptor